LVAEGIVNLDDAVDDGTFREIKPVADTAIPVESDDVSV
jgi:hypothetical protein